MPVFGRVVSRSGFKASRRRWPALCRVLWYGAGLPIEAMKRRRRGGIFILGGRRGPVVYDVQSRVFFFFSLLSLVQVRGDREIVS